METKEQPTDEMLLRMKGDCENALKTVREAIALQPMEEMTTLLGWLECGEKALNTLIEVHHETPTKDIESLKSIMLWFLVSHSGGLDELRQGIRQIKAPPNTNRMRKSQRRPNR